MSQRTSSPKTKTTTMNTIDNSTKGAPAGAMLSTSAAPGTDGPAFTPATLLKVSEQHKSELRQAFDMFDTQGTGRIKAHEVKVALYALGYDVGNAELHQLLRAANTESTEMMDFNDFYNVLVLKMTQKETRMECVRAFRQIDEDDKGAISLEDLRHISDSLHMGLTDDELIEMILFAHPPPTPGLTDDGTSAAEFDAKEALTVPEDEFLKLMRRANVY